MTSGNQRNDATLGRRRRGHFGLLLPNGFRAEALRLAAQSLWRAKNYFGDLYRRWKARLGAPKAITALAHT